jgi:hypothetical protein
VPKWYCPWYIFSAVQPCGLIYRLLSTCVSFIQIFEHFQGLSGELIKVNNPHLNPLINTIRKIRAGNVRYIKGDGLHLTLLGDKA